jgi:hypothetical protein
MTRGGSKPPAVGIRLRVGWLGLRARAVAKGGEGGGDNGESSDGGTSGATRQWSVVIAEFRFEADEECRRQT